MFKKIAFVVPAVLLSGAVMATNQAQLPQGVVDGQVRFGATSVDLTHARIVDTTNGNQKITDAVGITRTGYFYGQNVFINHPAYKQYVRAYAGSNVYYNASMFTSPECVNGATRLTWINGGVTDVPDGCSLQQQVVQWSRAQ